MNTKDLEKPMCDTKEL